MRTEPDELTVKLEELKREDPQGYGYLSQYWDDAKQGLDNTSRNYPCVAQIHENIPDPEISTRALGKTLVILADLDVITVQTNRSNATIYDLTAYDPDRLSAIGDILSS